MLFEYLPDIILLDEPSSNLDFDSIELLRGIIMEWKRQGKTIIISEHRLWYLKDAVDRVIYMENGKIARKWTGDEFIALSEDEVKSYKLRPIILEEELIRDIRGVSAASFSETDSSIELKDFYIDFEIFCDEFCVCHGMFNEVAEHIGYILFP